MQWKSNEYFIAHLCIAMQFIQFWKYKSEISFASIHLSPTLQKKNKSVQLNVKVYFTVSCALKVFNDSLNYERCFFQSNNKWSRRREKKIEKSFEGKCERPLSVVVWEKDSISVNKTNNLPRLQKNNQI